MGTIKKYIWVAHLFAIAICSYFAAQTVTTYLGMVMAPESDVASQVRAAQASIDQLGKISVYDPVVDRNFFSSVEIKDAQEPSKSAVKKARVDLTGEAVKTTLNIKVLGTIMVGGGEGPRSSAAITGGKSRKPAIYYVGGEETFAEGVDLLRVKRDRIEFSNKGRLEYAMLDGMEIGDSIFRSASEVHGSDKPAKKKMSARKASEEIEEVEEDDEPSGDAFVIEQSEIDDALANLDKLYTEIRIVPNFQDGKAAGMKVLAIKPGSLFSKLGLQRGDILEKINGLELTIKSGMQLFGQLKDQKSIKIELVRRGQSKTLEYEIR